jgi:probable rRNA maturation factor
MATAGRRGARIMPDGDTPRRLRVVCTDRLGRPVRARGLARWLEHIAPPGARGAVTIALVSDAEMRRLNRQYRGQNRVTDVLSFPTFAPDPRGASVGRPALAPDPRGASVGRPGLAPASRGTSVGKRAFADASPRSLAGKEETGLGEIVIARGVAAAQARRAGHSVALEFRVLALHGLLHLLGYDHERDNGRMQRVETRLRARGGLPVGVIERTGARASR